MKKISSSLCIFSLCLLALPAHSRSGNPDPLRSSTQMLVVTTADWNDVEGTVQRYERANSKAQWKPVGSPINVVVGKNGLGWGTGLVAAPHAPDDPVKKEGDGKAPAGIFLLGTAFGYADQEQPGWKMPYLPLKPSTECVDDTGSKFYNQLVDRGSEPASWKSSEQMRRADDLYRWGIFVDHNSNPPATGGGSCIFLHIWRGPGQGTVGCTAMAGSDIESVLSWLDPKKSPVLVQLPLAQYKMLKKQWKLPAQRL